MKAADWNDVQKAGGSAAVLRAWDGLPVASPVADAAPSTPYAAKPYVWTPPDRVPPREPLYGRHLFRGFVSGTSGAGGGGKSSLNVAETLAMASGRRLFGKFTPGPLKVWHWNLEDPHDEMVRRIQAAALHYGITEEEIGDRLFLNDGRETPLIIATKDGDRITVHEPLVDALVSEIKRLGVDLIRIDPFVSSHALPENDNTAIDRAVKAWGMVAERAGCAVELVHHVRKSGGEEITAESTRGAKAFVDGLRNVRVLNRMTEAEGKRAGVQQHRAFFRVQSDKSNLGPPDDADWYQIISVDLGNGDSVGVVTAWQWPDAFADVTVHDLMAVQRAIDGKQYRQSVQAADWIGYAVADVLGLDTDDAAAREKIKSLIGTWIANGALVVVKLKDPKKGVERPVVEVGRWAV